jgi:hypothetical protein
MRLLILNCSARKHGSEDLIPAIERYDGPVWQLLRSYLRDHQPIVPPLDVYVLSAAFGLIPADKPIPWYDQTMDPAQAELLRPSVLATFKTLMQRGYDQLCLGLSQRYLQAMQGWEAVVPVTVQVTLTDGPMGMKLGQLRAWLRGYEWQRNVEQPQRLEAAEQPRGEAVIGGVALRLSQEEVLAQARLALANDTVGAQRRYRHWYVRIDGAPVAPKWLVSQLTGLPTSAFDAGAARRVLLALGFDIEHV